jgi:hypothetical protein
MFQVFFVNFDCALPNPERSEGEEQLRLKGLDTYEAAIFCASLKAQAESMARQERQEKQDACLRLAAGEAALEPVAGQFNTCAASTATRGGGAPAPPVAPAAAVEGTRMVTAASSPATRQLHSRLASAAGAEGSAEESHPAVFAAATAAAAVAARSPPSSSAHPGSVTCILATAAAATATAATSAASASATLPAVPRGSLHNRVHKSPLKHIAASAMKLGAALLGVRPPQS